MSIGGALTVWKHASNGAPSTNVDYSSSTRSVSPSFDLETVDSTTFGDSYKDFESSFKNATIEAVYKYSTAMWTVITDLYNGGATITFEYGPDGTTTGKPKVTGSMFITKFSPPTTVGALIEMTASFQVTGAVVWSTYS
jgi:hypothetical protein